MTTQDNNTEDEIVVDDYDQEVMDAAKAFFAAIDRHMQALPDYIQYRTHNAEQAMINGVPTKRAIVSTAKVWIDSIAGDLSNEAFREFWVRDPEEEEEEAA